MSLRVWLPLNGTLDNQGLDDVVVTNNGATVDNNGKIGKCYSFGTNKSYLTISKDFITNFSTEASVCFWFKIISWNSSYATFFQAGLGNTYWNHYIFSFLRNNNNSNCCFTISNGSSASNASYLTSNFDLDKWYHIGLIYKTGHCLIYINGELYQDYVTTIVPKFSDITTISLGISNTLNSYQTNCKMNDFRIYDHALSPLEVKQISQGLILHYPLNRNGWGQKNLLKDSKNQRNSKNTYIYWPFTSEDISKISGNVCTISFDAKSTTNNVACDVYFRSNNNMVGSSIIVSNITTKYKRYSVTMTAPTSTFVSICIRNNGNVSGASTTATYSYKNIKVELGQKATPWCPNEADELYDKLGLNDNIQYDTSGYGNNGTKVGNFDYSSDTPKYNVSMVFNGTDNCIQLENISSLLQDVFTINLWFKKDDLGSKTYETLFGGPSGFEMDTRSGSSQTLSLYMASTRGGNVYSPFDFGEWYMITLVNDGTNELYYVNGELVKTITKKSMPSGNYFIGAWQTNVKQNYKGLISDFRVYTTALSAQNVLSLYNNSAYIDNEGNIYGAVYEEV